MSNIEWTDRTWNPVSGCTRVSAGCDNCYAVAMTHRLEGMGQTAKYGGLTVLNPKGDRHFNGVVRCHDDALALPLKWKKPARIFVNSMSDLFHRDVPFEFIDKVFAVMALCPHLTFQVLTKRPERMAEYLNEKRQLPAHLTTTGKIEWEGREDLVKENEIINQVLAEHLGDAEWWDDEGNSRVYQQRWPLPNVWLGTSVEDQASADERIPHLFKCPAAVRFLSIEPLLGPVDFVQASNWLRCSGCRHIGSTNEFYRRELSPRCVKCGRSHSFIGDGGDVDWVIVGGESGPGARACDIDWIRSIVGQCEAARVPVFVKQLGSGHLSLHTRAGRGRQFKDGLNTFVLKDSRGGNMSEWPDDLRVREFPTGGNQ